MCSRAIIQLVVTGRVVLQGYNTIVVTGRGVLQSYNTMVVTDRGVFQGPVQLRVCAVQQDSGAGTLP